MFRVFFVVILIVWFCIWKRRLLFIYKGRVSCRWEVLFVFIFVEKRDLECFRFGVVMVVFF